MVEMFRVGEQIKLNENNGGRTRTRTLDPLIKSQLFLQLFQSRSCKPIEFDPLISLKNFNRCKLSCDTDPAGNWGRFKDIGRHAFGDGPNRRSSVEWV
jgi:hypothetical protein